VFVAGERGRARRENGASRGADARGPGGRPATAADERVDGTDDEDEDEDDDDDDNGEDGRQ